LPIKRPETNPRPAPGGGFCCCRRRIRDSSKARFRAENTSPLRCRALRNESDRIGTGARRRWFFSHNRDRGTAAMKGVFLRAAAVLAGVTAYVALGIALASAG